MKSKYFILGAGGMAREAFQIYRHLKKEGTIGGFVINVGNLEEKKIYGITVLNEINDNQKDIFLIGAIGSPLRKTWINDLENRGYIFDTLIDPSCIKGLNVTIGIGSIVCSHVILTCDINIGKHTIINCNSTVHHDVNIGSYVTLGPGSVITGNVAIGEGTFIGASTTIIPGIKIGKGCYIGAGSIVTSDIPDSYLAYGSPTKVVKKLEKPDWKKLI